MLASVVMLAMAVERVTAMLMVEHYEEMWSPVPTLGYYLLSATIAFCISLGLVLFCVPWIPKMFTYASLGVCFCMTGTVFSILPIVAGRAYRKVQAQRNATVLERFQTGRNLKAARMLMYLAPYKVSTTLFSLGIYITTYELAPDIYVPLLAMIYWYYNLVQVRAVTGERLILDKDEGQDLYFRGLHAAWDVIERRQQTLFEIGHNASKFALNTTKFLLSRVSKVAPSESSEAIYISDLPRKEDLRSLSSKEDVNFTTPKTIELDVKALEQLENPLQTAPNADHGAEAAHAKHLVEIILRQAVDRLNEIDKQFGQPNTTVCTASRGEDDDGLTGKHLGKHNSTVGL
ncbi:unnamed protein product, partial [Mesorhabditis spiculigera]